MAGLLDWLGSPVQQQPGIAGFGGLNRGQVLFGGLKDAADSLSGGPGNTLDKLRLQGQQALEQGKQDEFRRGLAAAIGDPSNPNLAAARAYMLQHLDQAGDASPVMGILNIGRQDNTPIRANPGDTFLDPKTYKPIASVPALPKAPLYRTFHQGTNNIDAVSYDNGMTWKPVQIGGQDAIAGRYKPAAAKPSAGAGIAAPWTLYGGQ